ncbi:lysophospholipid acyltransferase LPCAT4 [Micropterus dolomieu]|uniref:lysophospholipid acyltransferase LPCAT4 n=1 Tax=Micropterus dolomieu TaxID=147949 RepID=UPI001E8E8339|nr:lysophospholipid acyltransferase LPCAT4 [Micropterus dolomieu]XP_045920539.1 lysophospholipid acyltransferase LPCAT4 [Micropterus dolomieu]XP_045920540.1 lysophospholipid acyltransferase LPCAT4 [Micropterus dolomieu]XP_045920541.1 lysophospholipid acyltransferase LPCAT4 [Micropterus dolomieu]
MESYDGYSATHEHPDPFIHDLKLTRAQRIKGIILGSILFPLRVILAALCFLIMWPLARLRLAGLPEEERSRPVKGWRLWLLHPMLLWLSRAAFFFLGFLWVKVKGRRADLKEAPVLVVAPHSSFLDMMVLCQTQLATVVSRSENTSLPVIGALLEFNQSVLVSRKDPQSRKKAVAQVKERLTSNGYWPQMLMFPEGTTTNGSALIKFKPGAFLAGVPVQPVLLRYPNKLDTTRWTYKGTSWLEALWYTTSQFYTNMTIEFLPVYSPSQEEKDDPDLYADNVQKLMAKALRVPATDYVMEGRVPVNKVGGLSLPLVSPARETLSLLRRNGLGARDVEAALERMIDRCQSGAQGSKASAEELASILRLTDKQTAVTICGLFSRDETVDLRQIYVSVAAVLGFVSFKSLLHTAFALFDGEGRGSLSAEELSGLMGALLGVPQHHTAELYALAGNQEQLTEENLLQVLTSHPTYQKALSKYIPSVPLANGKAVNKNGNVHNSNGHLHYKEKFE